MRLVASVRASLSRGGHTRWPGRSPGSLVAGGLALGAACFGASSTEVLAPVREQVITLQQGWNAVFLEVHPTESDPATLFAGTPIEIVASFYDRPSATQFVTDPHADLFKREGWAVWYAESRPDAVLQSLFAVHGQRAYLVQSSADFTWRVKGRVTPPEVHWQPDAYNLVGFGVSSDAPPTFAQFFAGSPAHRHNRLYRMANGVWQRVSDPGGALMRSGEAFWIYCEGASTYQGPLSVETLTRNGVVLGDGTGDVTLRNRTSHPVQPEVHHLPAVGDPVPLAIVVQVTRDPRQPIKHVPVAKPEGSWTQALPPLEAGHAVRIPLSARREAMRSFAQVSLLKIATDLGTETWVPVIAIREDLEEK
jgi:hypothetical protein